MENFRPFGISNFEEIKSKYSKYLKEIRKRLFITIYVFLASALVGFFFYEQIIKFLVGILSYQGINIVFTSPFQFINLSVSCGLATGLVAVFPLLIWLVWPAQREQKHY